jgi:hypothetical protein
MDFYDIINESFEIEDKKNVLEEGVILANPFLALALLKKKFVEGKENNILKKIGKETIDKKNELRSKALISKEKLSGKLLGKSGSGEDATVYRLTKEQKEVAVDMFEKYGEELLKEILEFRENVLAPYSIIKRMTLKNSHVTSADVIGMGKKEADVLYNSAKKKIERRGKLLDELQEAKRKFLKLETEITILKKISNDLKKGELNPKILRRLYKELGLSESDLGGFSKQKLRTAYDTIKSSTKKLEKIIAGEESDDRATDLIKKAEDAKSGKVDMYDSNKNTFESGNKEFEIALMKYTLRKEIQNKIIDGKTNINNKKYFLMYYKMIRKLLEHENKKRKEIAENLKKHTQDTKLTKEERKVLRPKNGESWEATSMDSFIRAYDPEDFQKANYGVKKSKELSKAEQQIENEIRRFERSLKKIVSEEDYKKIKKYRLINNLITVKELKDPNKLFKSSEEIKSIDKEGEE